MVNSDSEDDEVPARRWDLPFDHTTNDRRQSHRLLDSTPTQDPVPLVITEPLTVRLVQFTLLTPRLLTTLTSPIGWL